MAAGPSVARGDCAAELHLARGRMAFWLAHSESEPYVTFERISFDPQVMGGRACIRGIRITVSLVVNLVANGMSVEEIRQEYPALEAEDIREALQYAATLATEEGHPLVLR